MLAVVAFAGLLRYVASAPGVVNAVLLAPLKPGKLPSEMLPKKGEFEPLALTSKRMLLKPIPPGRPPT